MSQTIEIEEIVKDVESEYVEELKTALKAAEKAGKVMDSYSNRNAVVEKRKSSYSDLVTEADIECQKAIIEVISDSYPQDSFLAEEEGLKPDSKDRYWVIDPIDGTTNFMTGFDYFCTSIALRVKHESKIGVVYSPETGLNKLFYAVKDEGSYVKGINSGKIRKLETSQRSLKDSSVVIDHSNLDDKSRHINGEFINSLMKTGMSFRRPGSAALNLANIGAGSLDGAIIHVNDWDYAAGSLIIEEAGGEVNLNQIKSNNLTEVISSNGIIQENLSERNARYFNSEKQ